MTETLTSGLLASAGGGGGGGGGGFNPVAFLLPRGIGLLEFLLITELVLLGTMGVYGFVLKRLIQSPRDSVVVFHRIFWRIFLRPKAMTQLEAYDAPAAMNEFDVDQIAVLDDHAGGPAYAGGGAVAADPAAHTMGTMGGVSADLSGTLGDSVLQDAIPPEPAPVMVGDEPLEAEVMVVLNPHAPAAGITDVNGETITLCVPCGGEDGLANRHLLHALCHGLQIDTHQVTLLKGHNKAEKHVRISGMTLQTVQTKLMNATSV